MTRNSPAARHEILRGEEGNRYRFFCGASGAAVQCMNIALGLDETTGLVI